MTEPIDAALGIEDTSRHGHRAGFVAIVGRPNVGKSTLLNRYAGQKIAAVSNKPQTTRQRIRAIVSRDESQIIFVDTPGIHKPLHLLGETLVKQAQEALKEVDGVVFMVDASEAPGPGDRFVAKMVSNCGKPAVLALNKLDRGHLTADHLEQYKAMGKWEDVIAVSAQRGKNCQILLKALARLMPIGPALYDPEEVTDQTMRQIAGEMIREQVLRQTEEEIPHAVAVRIETWEDKSPELTVISATIFVERNSQKGIVIGQGGLMLKSIGAKARVEIEKQLEHPIFLELWVKVMPHWRREKKSLERLGYVVD